MGRAASSWVLVERCWMAYQSPLLPQPRKLRSCLGCFAHKILQKNCVRETKQSSSCSMLFCNPCTVRAAGEVGPTM